tara:strand:+ start:5762 stop:7513 length:1752 start_codon:yes stop_codon:yes gene_type:complete
MENLNIRNMVLNLSVGQHKIHCPSFECRERKKKSLKTLSVKVDKEGAVFFCHHCDLSGSEFHEKKQEVVPMSVMKSIDEKELTNNSLEWLSKRGISEKTAKRIGLKSVTNYINSVGHETECIMFPYTNQGQVYASKIRSIKEKGFACNGSPQTFFNIDTIDWEKPLVICEGEVDLISFIESDWSNVVSVPNGAVMKVAEGEINPESDSKFKFLWNAKDQLKDIKKVIIATDNDSAGKAMSEEIARRIGRHKCFRLEYPDGCKDANDVLMKKGSLELLTLIDEAEPFPVSGLYSAEHFFKRLDKLYSEGFGSGESTGYSNVDDLFTIVPSQLSIVTGHPSSGKSEFVDQLMINLAKKKGWKFAVASFENQPDIHIAKLISKIVGKPFFQGLQPRLSEKELEYGKKFLQDHFSFVYQADGSLPTLDSLLERLRVSVLRSGIKGCVIDPYNYINRSNVDEKETDWVSSMLSQLRVFAQSYDIHMWFIAHPTKMMRDTSGKVPVPKGYDISGSASFFSKADLGVTVHRPDPSNSTLAEIHCWKCRYAWVGKQGDTVLNYDPLTSSYAQVKPKGMYDEFLVRDDAPSF